MGINPIKLHGAWDEGYALDYHVISSSYLGDNVYGHPRYDTVRSEIGEALFLFKYRNNYDKLKEIIALAKPFLDEWEALKTVDVVIPAPASGKERSYQPAFEIAREIADYLNIAYVEDVLIKTAGPQSKDSSFDEKQEISGTIIAQKKATREHNILLVDDLFQSGATLQECVRVLRQDAKLKRVFVLTMTKAKG